MSRGKGGKGEHAPRGWGGGRSNLPGPKPEGCRTIWIGWLDDKPVEEEVIEFFKDCGPVVEVRSSERHIRGFFAHVQFETTENVDEAMKKQGETAFGIRIQIDWAYMDKVQTTNTQAEAPNSRRYRPKSVKPPNGHTLWIGDVSIDACEQDLVDLFEPCGKLEMICLQVNQLRNGQFGHMKFFETDAVDKAVELAGTAVKGVPLRLDFAEDKPMQAYRVGKDRAQPESTKPQDCRTVWVGGLPSDCNEDMIHSLFERCGEIREVRLDCSKRSGTMFCHVEYADTTAIDRAVRLSGERLNSSKIRVDFAENRKHEPGSQGKGYGKDGKGGPMPMFDPHMPPGMMFGPGGPWSRPPFPGPMGMPPPGGMLPLPAPDGKGGPGDAPPGNFMPPGSFPRGPRVVPPPPGAPGGPPLGSVPPGGPGGPPGGPDGGPPLGPPPGWDPRGPPPPGWDPMRPPPPDFFGYPGFYGYPPPPGFPGGGKGGPPPPQDFYGYPGPDPRFGGPPPGPPGYPGGPSGPPGPEGGAYTGPEGYPGPQPPGPTVPGAPPGGRARSRSAGSSYSYSSYYSYSPSPSKSPARNP